MIQISHLKFSYPEGDFHLDIESLSIESGSSVAVIGPSGTGKTTLMNLISGVIRPDSGMVITHETKISLLDDAKRRDFRIQQIGMIFQEFELLEYLNVRDNILLPYRVNRELRLGAEVRERARSLAGRVGIDDKLSRPVDRLSQGERQRVAICRALLPEPVLILADEPTGNLDPTTRTRVLDILFEFAADAGSTLLTVTHDHGLLDLFDQTIDVADWRSA